MLSKAKRKEYFKKCGLGEYNATNILKLQKKYFPKKTGSKNNWDGKYGNDTETLLRHVYNVKKNCKNFKPEEFKCGCKGKYCTGYPTYMKADILKNIQTIRSKYGKAMTITCGLRCKSYNAKLNGSSSSSRHLSGKAVDFYMKGVTDTLAHRKSTIKYLKKLSKHNYSYGNGIDSLGKKINSPNMGNALHTDTK